MDKNNNNNLTTVSLDVKAIIWLSRLLNNISRGFGIPAGKWTKLGVKALKDSSHLEMVHIMTDDLLENSIIPLDIIEDIENEELCLPFKLDDKDLSALIRALIDSVLDYHAAYIKCMNYSSSLETEIKEKDKSSKHFLHVISKAYPNILIYDEEKDDYGVELPDDFDFEDNDEDDGCSGCRYYEDGCQW